MSLGNGVGKICYKKRGRYIHNMTNILTKQLRNFFSLNDQEVKFIEQFYKLIEKETTETLNNADNKYIRLGGVDPLYTNAYTIFLYKFSRFCYEKYFIELATKIYYLNKIMNSVELFYEVELPKYFYLDHPLGSVMGRAKYGEYFMFSQGCTVGENKGVYPKMGDFVIMYSNSKIIGASTIGNNCIISANTYIKDTVVPDNTVVFQNNRELIFKENKLNNRVKWLLE